MRGHARKITRQRKSTIRLVVQWQRLPRFPAKMTLFHARNTTYYWENLVLVVVLVLDLKVRDLRLQNERLSWYMINSGGVTLTRAYSSLSSTFPFLHSSVTTCFFAPFPSPFVFRKKERNTSLFEANINTVLHQTNDRAVFVWPWKIVLVSVRYLFY